MDIPDDSYDSSSMMFVAESMTNDPQEIGALRPSRWQLLGGVDAELAGLQRQRRDLPGGAGGTRRRQSADRSPKPPRPSTPKSTSTSAKATKACCWSPAAASRHNRGVHGNGAVFFAAGTDPAPASSRCRPSGRNRASRADGPTREIDDPSRRAGPVFASLTVQDFSGRQAAGCYASSTLLHEFATVFPAHAGMTPDPHSLPPRFPCVPRTRRDDSGLLIQTKAKFGCCPLTQG